eukprot:11154360-Lingulodinium_polyedra.AAC.1
MAEIQRRGRWVAQSSLRRYERGGRTNELLGRLAAAQLQLATRCADQIGETLAGLRPPCALAASRRSSLS